ncbi:MAG: glycogen/starch/alpha-glucan phosphorylase [Candidatus Omnitrophota bacterium]
MGKSKKLPHYRISRVGMDKKSIQKSFRHNLLCTLAKDKFTATERDNYMALALAIRDRLAKRWISTQQRYHRTKKKRIYYLSLEFLIGRLLGSNLLNLNIQNEAKEALEELGLSLEDIREQELDAGLGNGGLGRLAACFLDSMATLGIPAHGYGIRYDYGIFHQRIANGNQIEMPDTWLKFGYAWEFERPEYSVPIKFYGQLKQYTDSDGKQSTEWVDTENVLAVPYDIPVSGYRNNIVNTLRLWSAGSTEEFNFNYFNHGDYEQAVHDEILSENISKVLYPNDNIYRGKELRLKQEYFFTAASISDIIRRFKEDNKDLLDLPKKAIIQLNDTHPTLAIVELMRILIDNERLDWDTAWKITQKTFAYTNHSTMPEALETWPVPLFEKLLPRHLQLIYDINQEFLKTVSKKYKGDMGKISRMSIIEEGEPKRVRMANLCIIGSHSVNGVSELHTELLKNVIFRDFFDVYPQKFNNKTNGVAHRRWLLKANPPLSGLITKAISDNWITDLENLEKLLPLKDDAAFKEKWRRVKLENKKRFAEYIKKTNGIAINPDSLFDVQVKRIHEYKRQLLFAFYIISEYLKAKGSPSSEMVPRTFIIGGKSAPGYFMAKLIIKFINNAADVINNDKDIGGLFKVVFLENYRVSLAEKVLPGCDLSEQISTAGTEASGTGCMKFMMNGALTIGTLDGANIEMAEALGSENIFTFGLDSQQVRDLRSSGYNPDEYRKRSQALREIISLIQSNFFSPHEKGIFDPIVQMLLSHDYFLVLADFEAYTAKQNEVSGLYKNTSEWTAKSIINVARSGRFSSDRTIREYARDIWGIPCKAKNK